MNSSIMVFYNSLKEWLSMYIVELHCILLEIIVVIEANLYVWVTRVKPIWPIVKNLQHNQNTCALLIF